LKSTSSLPRPALGTGAFFNLRAASPDDFTVLHEVNIAKAITAKEMIFNIGCLMSNYWLN
jgi:hypothetical protein